MRAIRYYEEFGLLQPGGHSAGGFRLYTRGHLRRLQVIQFLKALGLSLTEIRDILTAKQASGGTKQTVEFLLRVFAEKLDQVEGKIATLSRMKEELQRSISLLHSCDQCDHTVLLDAASCSNCSHLEPREAVPDTFEVILQ